MTKVRPVLVVQNDLGNIHGSETIVAGIRGGRAHPLPILVAVPAGACGLDKNSVVDTGQLATLPSASLTRKLGSMPPAIMDLVDRALEVSLGLEP